MKQKTLPQLKKQALELFSILTKLRYLQKGELRCYTCGKPLRANTSDCQLGHFLSRGAYPGLTFHPDNSRLQCFRCNCLLHGNTIEFRERLIAEIGLEEVEALEAKRHELVKLSRIDYLEKIQFYKNEIKELQ